MIPNSWQATIIAGAVTAVVAFGAGWTVNGWRMEGNLRDAVTAAEQAIRAECKNNQNITKEVADGLHQKLRAADARHADTVSRLLSHEATKRMQSSAPAFGDDGSPGTDGLPGADPAFALAVIDGGRNAERQAEQLIACQEFIRKTWDAR